MTYAGDIRLIAKTKELLDKTNKALASITELKKDAIEVRRSIAFQEGDGGNKANSGDNASDDTLDATDSSGNPLPVPKNTATADDATQTDTTTTTDAGRIQQSQAGITVASTGSASSNNNDLSDKVTPTAGGTGVGMSDFKDQAELGANDAEWQTIESALVANGATQSEIDAQRREYNQKQDGVHEVGDVHDGYSGPKASPSVFSSPRGTQKPTPGYERLDGLVGVDPDDSNLHILVRLDNKSSIPSITDSLAAGQRDWPVDGTAPERGDYFSGFIWADSIGGFHNNTDGAVNVTIANEALAEAFIKWNDITYDDPADLVETSVGTCPLSIADACTNAQIAIEFQVSRVGGGQPFNLSITSTRCDRLGGLTGAQTTACGLPAPLQSSHPVTSTYVLTRQGGKFVWSEFDSEVPLKYKTDNSTVVIKSESTGRTYNIDPAIDGGFLLYDANNPAFVLYYDKNRILRDSIDPALFRYYLPRDS